MLYDAGGRVRGVATGNMGVTKAGGEGPNFQPGMELHAKLTLFAEGCRGSLTKTLMERFKLRDGMQPQTYGLGVKELWEVQPAQHVTGKVIHTIGWPVDTHTYGGSWLYMFGENLVSVGYVVGLDYENPNLSPFEEMQRYKTHPAIRPILEGGRRIAYGARALSEGGFQSIPKLVFPGGALIGDTAGFLNVPKIKGTHTAMKSGMVAAEAAFDALKDGAEAPELTAYPERLKRSWLWDELRGVRNIRPAFHWGLWPGVAYSALDTYVLRGHAPWTLGHRADHTTLRPAADCAPIAYPRPDGKLTFDRLSSVFLSNTNHEEDQPVHLRLKDPSVAERINLAALRRPGAALLPGRGLRVRRWRRRRPSPADQRAELRPLQDLRHQGPDPEHRLGHPRGRRRAELYRWDVSGDGCAIEAHANGQRFKENQGMNNLNGYDIEDLAVGMTAIFAKTITEADIVLFAAASGDNNAVHINEQFAKTTSFGGRIAHGFLTASVISAAVANRLPGPGAIYISQQMSFKAPVRPGDTVEATVRVKEIILARSRVVLETTCRVGDIVVIEGEALVKTTSLAKREAVAGSLAKVA